MMYTSVLKWGNNILFRGYDEDGKRAHFKANYEPVLYTSTSHSGASTRHGLHGELIRPLQFESMKRAKEFISGTKSGDVYGIERFEYQFTRDHMIDELVGCGSYLTGSTTAQYIDRILDTSKIKIGYIDIETECEDGFPDIESANEEIILITMCCGDKMVTIASDKYSGSSKYVPEEPGHVYIECETELELLSKFLKYLREFDPDIITGWNVNLFDLPYTYNRIRRMMSEDRAKDMSPWGIVHERNAVINGKPQQRYVFHGYNILDYYDLYRKFTYQQQSSYKLDYIASVELGEKKLSYKEYDSMHSFYKSDWKKFVSYNVKDVTLVRAFEKKMKFIELACAITYDAGANPQDVFSQVRLWDCKIYNHLMDKGVVIPVQKHGRNASTETTDQYIGAYVKEPVPGNYDWIMTFDVSSMYPNAIRYLNISPDTIIEPHEIDDSFLAQYVSHAKSNPVAMIDTIVSGDTLTSDNLGTAAKDSNVCVSPTGDLYKKDVDGFLPDIMRDLFNTRSESKKKSHEYEKRAVELHDEIVARGLEERLTQE